MIELSTLSVFPLLVRSTGLRNHILPLALFNTPNTTCTQGFWQNVQFRAAFSAPLQSTNNYVYDKNYPPPLVFSSFSSLATAGSSVFIC